MSKLIQYYGYGKVYKPKHLKAKSLYTGGIYTIPNLATVMDSDGNQFVVPKSVFDTDGNEFTAGNIVYDSDGNAFTVI